MMLEFCLQIIYAKRSREMKRKGGDGKRGRVDGKGRESGWEDADGGECAKISPESHLCGIVPVGF